MRPTKLLRRLVVPLLALAIAAPASGQEPYRVADVNTVTTGSAHTHGFAIPYGWFGGESARFGAQAFFALDDGIHGTELWRTDGTPSGTALVVDLCPGSCASRPGDLIATAAGLFFHADDGVHGRELWTSDGTAAGTRLVVDAVPGHTGSMPADLVAFGDKVAYSAETPATGRELWCSDGTEAGTGLVLDIQPGGPSAWPSPLLATSAVAFFTAEDTDHGRELWATDCTPAGTEVLDLLAPGPASGLAHLYRQSRWYYGKIGEQLVFHSLELGQLWQSDGTASGTGPLADVESLQILGATATDLYWSGLDPISFDRSDLWATDGTPDGTRLVTALPDQHWIPSFGGAAPLAGRLHFVVAFEQRSQIWRTDGTEAGTESVVDLAVAPSPIHGLARLDDSRLLFFYGDSASGVEPWSSDGTEAGTAPLGEIAPGTASSWELWVEQRLHEPVRLGDGVILRLDASAGDLELWRLAPTGAERLSEVNDQSSSILLSNLGTTYQEGTFGANGEKVLFQASDGTLGLEPWKSDGTTAGTVLIADLVAGPESSHPWSVVSVNGRVLFAAWEASGSSTLWGTDPDTATVQPLAPSCSNVDTAGNLAFFVHEGRSEAEQALWRSDGTPEGTFPVGPFPQCWPGRAADAGGRLAFSDGSLWLSDGTPEGTVAVVGSPIVDWPCHLAAAGERLFFAGSDDAGQELWVLDAPDATARQVLDIGPGPADGIAPFHPDLERVPPRKLASLGARVVFLADNGTTGEEPWVSDGSEAGTLLLRDLSSGPRGADVTDLTSTGQRVFFVADDGVHGRELWSTDGTPDGTRLVLDIVPGSGSSIPRHLYAVGSQLVFTAWTPTHGAEAWATDGTPEGTFRLGDIAPGPLSSSPVHFTASSTLLFFAANDNVTGFEPWAIALHALASTPTDLFTVTPCRLFDSRDSATLGADLSRIPVAGRCGIPATARAVAANVTVTGATAAGHLGVAAALALHPAHEIVPFAEGQTRAQQTVLRLGYGEVDVQAVLDAAGTVDVIIDVAGYFQ